ncbi:uncharacterized protein LOC141848769 [Brevipalpus obovatus]|uniref:uncharacterized protein LOC141848769 n=1 Tax=Brevipalpus obovatus TaxID=246614 RepID=UPI003D9E1581
MMGLKRSLVAILLTSFVLTCFAADDYYYNVTITTSPTARAKFDNHEGKLKIKLKGINNLQKTGSQEFTLTSTPVNIKNDATWSFPIRTEIGYEKLQEIELRWTLKSPFNPIYLVSKPKIFFEPILVSINRVDGGIKRQIIRQFCAKKIPQAIEHSEEKSFKPCPIYN